MSGFKCAGGCNRIVLDRLLHRPVVFNIDCDSYRMRAHRARSEGIGEGVKPTAANWFHRRPTPAINWELQ